MNPQSIVVEYVDAAIEDLRRKGLLRRPDPNMPTEMRDPFTPSTDDWLAWRPIPSNVTDQDIQDLQAHFHGALPSCYIVLLKYVHFYGLTECGVRFEPHVPGHWKKQLMDLYDDHHGLFPKGSHLIPFGSEAFMDAGPVCFDFNNRQPDGDCPVVFWDHDCVGTDREISLLFSTSAKMFEALRFVARSPVDFIYHDPDTDSQEGLPLRRKLLAEFLRIDPDGAGGPARDYWMSWGVEPFEGE